MKKNIMKTKIKNIQIGDKMKFIMALKKEMQNTPIQILVGLYNDLKLCEKYKTSFYISNDYLYALYTNEFVSFKKEVEDEIEVEYKKKKFNFETNMIESDNALAEEDIWFNSLSVEHKEYVKRLNELLNPPPFA
jgi:hypothetical protein